MDIDRIEAAESAGVGPILIVDDDAGDRMICVRALRSAFGTDQVVLEADGGEAALDAVERNGLACVLLDFAMAGLNGLEVLKRIRIKSPYLPVIMIDGKGRDTIAVQSMREGAQDYIAKNAISPQILFRAVRVAIRHCELLKHDNERQMSMETVTHALAHELKEPANRIAYCLDRIADRRNLGEESQRSLDMIRESATRMGALVDAMLLYADLDLIEQVEREPCDLAAVAAKVRDAMAPLLAERGATIVIGPLPVVAGKGPLLAALFQNLLRNAVLHSHRPVTVTVGAQEVDGRWRVTVHDDGPGIATEDLEAIFRPFKRRSRGHDGTGLGLAIGRKIVELHGGRIWCESVLGMGASFIFDLPKHALLAPAQADAADAPPAPAPAAGRSGIARILFVDDNDLDLELMTVLLLDQPKLHCERFVANDGKQALAVLRNAAQDGNPIDLALIDINMPVMTGFELIAEMRADPQLRNTLAVMCTTSDYDKDRRMAEALGAVGYITKPPSFPKLREIIDRSGRFHFAESGATQTMMRNG